MRVREGLRRQRIAAGGAEIAVISGRPSPVVAARLADLGIAEAHLACGDKPGGHGAVREACELMSAALEDA